MSAISNLISSARKNKNLTQEELADLSKVNLRTIQRIENDENLPREHTLKSICNVLQLNPTEIQFSVKEKKLKYVEIFLDVFFLIIVNMLLMVIIGYLTLDFDANLNSKFAGFLLSFFIPIFIVYKTLKLSRAERMIKFGSGLFIYIILSIIMVGFPVPFASGLLICLALCLITLYYGDLIIK